MEVIPIEVLKRCIEQSVNERAGRYVALEEVEIDSTSVSATPTKGKNWGMRVKLKFTQIIWWAGGDLNSRPLPPPRVLEDTVSEETRLISRVLFGAAFAT